MKISGLLWALLLAAGGVDAAGLGKLSVQSALGQPLKAEIELLSVNKDELPGITATLAGADAFRQARIDRIAALASLRFTIDQRSNGQPVIRVSSSVPIADPFLDLLIEVNWNSGRLLREYTILLDPPAEARPAQPAALPETARTAPPQILAAPVERKPVAESARPRAPEAAPAKQPRRYGPVKSGETLRGIAAKVKQDGVTLEQMMVSLYRANQDAFLADNMNRLKRGRVLNVPDSEAVHLQVSPDQAIRAVRGHAADWHAYRQKVAEMAQETATARTPEAAAGKLAPKSEETPAPAAAPRDMLKLSKGEPGTTGRVDGKTQEKLHALEEELAAKGRALREAQDRVGQLERAVSDMQKLLALKAQAPVQPEPAPAAVAPAAMPVPAPAPAEAASEAEAPPVAPPPPVMKAQPVAAPVAMPEPAPPQGSSWISTFISNPLYIGGIVAAILLSVLLWMMMVGSRRRHGLNKFEDSIMTGGEFKNNAVFNASSSASSSGAGISTEGSMLLTDFSRLGLGAIDTHEVDPIAEAEVYMAYGRDAQAEEILKEALNKDPSRHEIALKLLEIYAARKDTQAFETVSSELYAGVGGIGPVWQRAAEMGRSIDPSNPLYRASATEMSTAASFTAKPAARPDASAFAAPLAAMPQDQTPEDDWDAPFPPSGRDEDFDLPAAADSLAPPAQAPKQDNFGADHSNKDYSLEFESAPQVPVAAPEPEPEPLSWETPASHEPEPIVAPESTPETLPETYDVADAPAWDEQGSDLEFDAAETFAEATPTSEEEASVPVLDLSGIDLDLDTTPADLELESALEMQVPVAAEPEVQATAEAFVAEVDASPAPDLVEEFAPASDDEPLDFLADAPFEAAPAEEVGEDVVDTAPAATPPADAIDPELWEEVNTKLDLARAYLEMGDQEGAREILQEVLGEGDAQQKADADKLLAEAG